MDYNSDHMKPRANSFKLFGLVQALVPRSAELGLVHAIKNQRYMHFAILANLLQARQRPASVIDPSICSLTAQVQVVILRLQFSFDIIPAEVADDEFVSNAGAAYLMLAALSESELICKLVLVGAGKCS